MDIKIKDHIINNFKETDIKEIKEAIESSIESDDEIVLPGLGVFMGIVWQASDEDSRNDILLKIKNNL